MQNESNKVSTGMALALTIGIMIVIGLIISAFEPRCSMSGCDEHVSEGEKYCILHEMSYRSYGNPDYHEVYRESQSRRNHTSTEKDFGSEVKKNITQSRPTKDYSSNNSYDEGYEDVYMDDDYDWDRYQTDSDYATGVDDAMEDEEW